MSSPFSTFTDKGKEKTSRNKLKGKEMKKNVQGFAMWSGISLAIILGYIGFGANLKALSFIEPSNWLASDTDFINSFKDQDGCKDPQKGGDDETTPAEEKEVDDNIKNTTISSLAKYIAKLSNEIPDPTMAPECFGRPTSSNSEKTLKCTTDLNGLYYQVKDVNDESIILKWITYGLSGFSATPGFALCGSIDRNNDDTSSQFYGGGGVAGEESIGAGGIIQRLFQQIQNQTLCVRQYVRTNQFLKTFLSDKVGTKSFNRKKEQEEEEEGENQNGGSEEDNNIAKMLKKASEGFKFFNDNITTYFSEDLIILLWPLLLVGVIIVSILQPFILLFDAMRDIFFSKNPIGGVSIGQADCFEDGKLNERFWDGDAIYKGIFKMFTEATSGYDAPVKLFWNSSYLLFTFIFWFIFAIIMSTKNFVFSIIDVLEKTLFFILPFSWKNYNMQQGVSGFTEMAKFFTKNLKVGILAWLFILVILAFSYLGTEFAVGGIFGLLAIAGYLIGTKTGILNYLQILLGTGKSKDPDDGKSVFDSILELFSQKPFFTTFVITFIAGITTTLVLLTNYVAF